jgi:hypothetical protein
MTKFPLKDDNLGNNFELKKKQNKAILKLHQALR